MNKENLINKILKQHKVSLAIENPLGQSTFLHIKMPDLSSASKTVWGDWGPMYTVATAEYPAIEFSTSSSKKSTGEWKKLNVKCLEINSPMMLDTRSQYPLYVQIKLPIGRLKVNIYYNNTAVPMKAEVLSDTSIHQGKKSFIGAEIVDLSSSSQQELKKQGVQHYAS